MPPKKRSFFERLTGSIRMEEDEPEVVQQPPRRAGGLYQARMAQDPYAYEEDSAEHYEEETLEVTSEEDIEEEPEEAQLAVDVYETNDAIIVRTMTAGVKKEDLQISVSREQLTLRGKRDNEPRAYQHQYHNQELYWGPFSRTIELPDEVDIDSASATEHHGLITIKLPKLDKKRQASLKIQ